MLRPGTVASATITFTFLCRRLAAAGLWGNSRIGSAMRRIRGFPGHAVYAPYDSVAMNVIQSGEEQVVLVLR